MYMLLSRSGGRLVGEEAPGVRTAQYSVSCRPVREASNGVSCRNRAVVAGTQSDVGTHSSPETAWYRHKKWEEERKMRTALTDKQDATW